MADTDIANEHLIRLQTARALVCKSARVFLESSGQATPEAFMELRALLECEAQESRNFRNAAERIERAHEEENYEWRNG